jgi:hypothetical protein
MAQTFDMVYHVGMARAFTLYGPAAGEWIRAQNGVKAVTDDERALRIATLVHRNMGKGAETQVAIDLIKRVASEGLESVADLCTAKPKGTAA